LAGKAARRYQGSLRGIYLIAVRASSEIAAIAARMLEFTGTVTEKDDDMADYDCMRRYSR
jgi:hypothetical protein